MTSFQQELENSLGKRIRLKINDNRSTMLSVRWEPDCTKVSLHRMFLQAPQNIMESLTCYLKRERRVMPTNIRAFIEENIKRLDYSHLLDSSKLETVGKIYDLEHFYNEINRDYFNRQLDLSITWFGKPKKKCQRRVTFGLYHDPLKLIKINRLLDQPTFPDYLLSFVIYHEMLHHVCPGYVDDGGMHHIHTKEFKKREVLFQHYEKAQRWIKEHPDQFFA